MFTNHHLYGIKIVLMENFTFFSVNTVFMRKTVIYKINQSLMYNKKGYLHSFDAMHLKVENLDFFIAKARQNEHFETFQEKKNLIDDFLALKRAVSKK